MKENIKNAKIESTMLGFEGHGFLTYWLYLDYGGSGQGFGGFVFPVLDEDGKVKKQDKKLYEKLSIYGTETIKRILQIVGVEKWEELSGKHIRVKLNDEPKGFGYGIEAIGNIIEDKWFSPNELHNELTKM